VSVAVPDKLIDLVERLHAAVDQMAQPLNAQHQSRLACRQGCAACCVDDLSVFEVEAAVIRRHHASLLASGQPRAAGACAMLDEQNGCRIYAHRPYVCRTQGLPLRWLDLEDEGGPNDELVERRDICSLNVDGPPIEELTAEACWTVGPVEKKLAELQDETEQPGARIRLRDLFSIRSPHRDSR